MDWLTSESMNESGDLTSDGFWNEGNDLRLHKCE